MPSLKERIDPREWVRALEDQWFDRSRHVQTIGLEAKPEASRIVGPRADSNIYGPVRAANVRAALRDLPVRDLSPYTFLDIGSGKGRVLFIAAEYPFRRVLGVEYDRAMHLVAEQNIAAFRHPGQRCHSIESVHANAADFEFPDGDLVVYLFNPFGPEILSKMLQNLQRAITQQPRHVLIMMLWAEHADVVARCPWLRQVHKTRRHIIFESTKMQ